MFTTIPLTPTFGVEVQGLDLGRPLPSACADALNKLLDTAFVILIRDQSIDADQQVALAAAWGKPDSRILDQLKRLKHPAAAGVTGTPVQHVSSVRPDGVLGNGELSFHNDELFFARPSRATMLHAIEVPSSGGETLFADLPTLCDRLPQEETAALAQFSALHVFGYSENGNASLRPGIPGDPSIPRHVHPLIHRDTTTGRSSLWMSLSNTVHLNETTPEESERIILSLCARITASDLIYAHEWRPRDTLIWNNLMVQHARRDFPTNEPRTLRRLTIG